MMADPDRAVGFAQRRRPRRLRSFLRHVRLAVKMSLADVGQHTFQVTLQPAAFPSFLDFWSEGGQHSDHREAHGCWHTD